MGAVRKLFADFALVCATTVTLAPGAAVAEVKSTPAGDPIATIRSFDRRLHSALERRSPAWSPEADAARVRVQEVVDDTFSVPDLARETLGAEWTRATPAQQRAFLNLFRDLLVQRIATGPLHAYTLAEEPKLVMHDDSSAKVRAVMCETSCDRHRAEIDYRLKRVAGRWHLIDLVVDGESVVKAYRAEFDDIIARERFDGLLARLRKRLG
jgi:phospholipid transport system substrate-binding protein